MLIFQINKLNLKSSKKASIVQFEYIKQYAYIDVNKNQQCILFNK